MRRRTDRGQVTLLMVGLAVLLVYVIAAVSDLSAGHLRQETARSFADGAALAAANGAAVPAGYSGGGHFVALDPVAARAAVDRYVRQTDTLPGTRWSVTVAGRVVTVDVTMPFDFPVRMPLFGSASTVRATGSATVPIY